MTNPDLTFSKASSAACVLGSVAENFKPAAVSCNSSDPLPVLAYVNGAGVDDDDESLESMVQKGASAPDTGKDSAPIEREPSATPDAPK